MSSRLDRAARRIGPPPDEPTDEENEEFRELMAGTARGLSRDELDRRWPEPDPDADDLDSTIYRIVRDEWFRQHPDAQRSSWLA